MHILVAAGLSFSGCGRGSAEVPRYRTAPVERRDVVRTVEASGMVVASRLSVVGATVEGRLVAVAVGPGDRVEQGQRLAEIGAPNLAFEVEARRAAHRSAVARREKARAERGLARAKLERTRRLAGRARASTAELEQAEAHARGATAAARAAESEVEAAAARLAGARQRSAAREIKAPRAGIVLTAPSALGAVVGPSQPALFELVEGLNPLALEVDVDEADIGAVAVGQGARFVVPAHPGREFEAEVERLGLSARRVGGLSVYRVRLRAENSEGALRVGMTADLRFEVARVEGALAVRDAALRFTPSGAAPAPPRSRVFVLRGDTLEEVRIRLGVEDGVFGAVTPVDGHRLELGEAVVVGRSSGVLQASQLELGGGG